MRAAIARRGQMVVEDVPEPIPGPGDALVEVKACGICGSDLHTLHHADSLLAVAELGGGESQFDPNADFIMGHEFSAEVVELGPGDGRGAGRGRRPRRLDAVRARRARGPRADRVLERLQRCATRTACG